LITPANLSGAVNQFAAKTATFLEVSNFNPEDFTARDVRRNQWRYLKTDKTVQAALDWLEDEGWIRIKKAAPKEGRPTQRYEVNPAIRSGSKI
jgi:hypothetical protein